MLTKAFKKYLNAYKLFFQIKNCKKNPKSSNLTTTFSKVTESIEANSETTNLEFSHFFFHNFLFVFYLVKAIFTFLWIQDSYFLTWLLEPMRKMQEISLIINVRTVELVSKSFSFQVLLTCIIVVFSHATNSLPWDYKPQLLSLKLNKLHFSSYLHYTALMFKCLWSLTQ